MVALSGSFLDRADANKAYWRDPEAEKKGITPAYRWTGPGRDGLEVVYNAEYVHNNQAVLLKAARWISAEPSSGILEPYSSTVIEIQLDSKDLDPGDYVGGGHHKRSR